MRPKNYIKLLLAAFLFCASNVKIQAQNRNEQDISTLQIHLKNSEDDLEKLKTRTNNLSRETSRMIADCKKCLSDKLFDESQADQIQVSICIGQAEKTISICHKNYNDIGILNSNIPIIDSLEGRAEGYEQIAEQDISLVHQFDEPIAFTAETVFKDRGPSKILGHSGLDASLSLPFVSVPMFEDFNFNNLNTSYGTTSQSTSSFSNVSSMVGLHGDLNFHVIKTNHFDFILFAGGTYCNLEFANDALGGSGGTSYFDYDLGGEIHVGGSNFKVFGQYKYGYRSMQDNTTSDETAYGGGISTTTGSASYSFQRVAAGFQINFDNDERERFFKVFTMLENPDYANAGYKYVGFGAIYKSWLDISFELIPNYPAAGSYNYTLTTTSSKGTFWYASIGKSFTLFDHN
jgi:hypothetical protein